MSSVAELRDTAVKDLLEYTRSVAKPNEVSSEDLENIKNSLVEMADRKEFWSEDQFPAPTDGQVHTRYLVSQDDDDSYALYLNVMHTGKKAPPHNHTTWACIASVEGEEYNYVYEPKEDGPLIPGDREIELSETIVVKPGQGIGLLPDDIHSIAINEGESTRHLHFYGRGLETLDRRLMWDQELKSCKVFVMDVKTTKDKAK